MRRLALAALIALAGMGWERAGAQTPQQNPLAAATARIEASRQVMLDAYQAGDLDRMMSGYHKDATYSGTLQPFWIKGADGIRDLWQRYFAAWPQRRLIFRDTDVRYYDENTSVETGYLEMYMTRLEPREAVLTNIRYSITRIRGDGSWPIVNMNIARLP